MKGQEVHHVLTDTGDSRAANIGWEFGVRNARGRPLPAYKVAQVPKKLMSGGGGGLWHFFFPTSKFLPQFCRHIVGVPFVHHKPLTSKKIIPIIKKNNKKKKIAREILISLWERENVVKCLSLTVNAWELAALGFCECVYTLSSRQCHLSISAIQ